MGPTDPARSHLSLNVLSQPDGPPLHPVDPLRIRILNQNSFQRFLLQCKKLYTSLAKILLTFLHTYIRMYKREASVVHGTPPLPAPKDVILHGGPITCFVTLQRPRLVGPKQRKHNTLYEATCVTQTKLWTCNSSLQVDQYTLEEPGDGALSALTLIALAAIIS